MPESVNLGWARDSIQTIQKTSSSGLKDTYTMTFKSGSQFTFEVTNGATQVTSETFEGINTPAKWEAVRNFVSNNFDYVLGIVLSCTNGMKYRLYADMQGYGVTSIFYHNGTSSSAPFTENDAIMIYPNLFSSSASAGELWNCDVTIIYCNESATEAAVPESRTIAGIDLEDDITKAELQNALDMGDLVPKTRTIAGIDLQDDITKSELKNAIKSIEASETMVFNSAIDLNDIKSNIVYKFQPYGGNVAHLPSGYDTTDAHEVLFYCIEYKFASDTRYMQVIFDWVKKVVYRRGFEGGSWGNWMVYDYGTVDFSTNQQLIKSSKDFVIYDNFDLNDVKTNSVYKIQPMPNSSNFSNLPSDYPSDYYGTTNLLITNFSVYSHNNVTRNEALQFLFLPYREVYYTRGWNSATNVWSSWVKHLFKQNNQIIEIGAGKTYTTLRAGFAAAYATTNAKVIVYSGTYDLETEFSDVLTNHTSARLTLGHGMDVYFHSGSYVKCLLDGTNEWAITYFEPFKVGDGDFKVEGLNIESSNTRYCVHDELASSSTPAIHKYINCVMKQSTTLANPGYYQCIGGGLGEKTTIIIEGGRYQTSVLSGEGGNPPDYYQQPITYHNGSSANCDNRIYISNIYVADKGYLSFGYYGASTVVSPIQISNCSFYSQPQVVAENSGAVNVNFSMTKWNNEIRGN